MMDDIDALRANLARHTGPARLRPLTELGQALANQYWRLGPGQPVARPALDEAVDVLAEAHGLLEPGEFLRAQTAALLGWLLGVRNIAHFSAETDRDRAIELLDEAVAMPSLPAVLQGMVGLVLGQLLITRELTSLQKSPQALMASIMASMTGSGGPSAALGATDIDRAVTCLRRVLDGPHVSAEMTETAQTMLEMAETARILTGSIGGQGGLDLGRMMRAMQDLQTMQAKAAAQPRTAGFAHRPNVFAFEADDIAQADPLSRPTATMVGAAPSAPVPDRPAPPPVPPVPADELRAALWKHLPGEGFAGLPATGSAGQNVDAVDEMAALASALVESADALPADHLLLAVALHARAVMDDGGGWGGAEDGADLRAAADALLAATPALLDGGPDIVAAAVALAAAMDARQAALDVRARLGAAFAPVADALRRVEADALVYPAPGRTLRFVAETGRFGKGEEPLRRSVVVGHDPGPGDGAVSLVRCANQLIELARRDVGPLSEAAVFVGNPRRDRQQSGADAMVLRRTFYPQSTGLGDTVEHSDGAGNPEDVAARLDASMLHLGCGITADGDLQLAGSAVLTVGEIAAHPPTDQGGLAILPPTGAGAPALVDALLAAGFRSVIAFRDELPPAVASLLYFLLHARLVDAGQAPADAVADVRRWLADPARELPDHLPPWYASTVPVDPAVLVHYGV